MRLSEMHRNETVRVTHQLCRRSEVRAITFEAFVGPVNDANNPSPKGLMVCRWRRRFTRLTTQGRQFRLLLLNNLQGCWRYPCGLPPEKSFPAKSNSLTLPQDGKSSLTSIFAPCIQTDLHTQTSVVLCRAQRLAAPSGFQPVCNS